MGPLLCLIGLADAFATGCYAYVRYAVVHSPGSLPFSTLALWVNTWAYAPATSLGAMVLLLVFPDGRLLSRRFRPALWTALAFIPLSIAAFAFYPQNLGPLFRYRHNPYAFPQLDWLYETCGALAIGFGVVAGVGAVANMTLRWRRSDRVGREQLKWLLAVLPFTIVSLIATLVFPGTWSLVLALPACDPDAHRYRDRGHQAPAVRDRHPAEPGGAVRPAHRRGGGRLPGRGPAIAHSLFGVQGRGLPVADHRHRAGRRRAVAAARPGAAPGGPAVLR